MAAGDIGLTQISGDVGFLIRVGQWLNGDGFANYEHAFVDCGDGTIIQAMPGGAQHVINPYRNSDVTYLRAPIALGAKVAAAARKYKGVPYSFLDYLSIAAHRVRLPVPFLKRYIRNSGHMICSQLADQAAADAGWVLFDDGRWPGYVAPGDLYKLVGDRVKTS